MYKADALICSHEVILLTLARDIGELVLKSVSKGKPKQEKSSWYNIVVSSNSSRAITFTFGQRPLEKVINPVIPPSIMG